MDVLEALDAFDPRDSRLSPLFSLIGNDEDAA